MYMARGVLADEIYNKTTDAMASAPENSVAVTLMSADVEHILTGCLNIHEFCANAIQVGLASLLISRRIEPSSVGPLIMVGFCVVSTSVLMRFIGPRQRAWMQAAQKRLSLTASVIGEIENIKISYLQSQD